MVKFEGENGIHLQNILLDLCARFHCTMKEIKTLFVQACCRNLVYNEIADMIFYILTGDEE